MTDAVAVVDHSLPMRREEIVQQVKLIQEMMNDVMKDGDHYGTIPGTPKPTLYKAGAEKLCLTFRMAPDYDIEVVDLEGEHREYRVKCRLLSIQTGQFLGAGVGSCSTKESKYRWRQGSRECPDCGHEDAIIKGKEQYGGGWICFAKKGGCGAKFEDDDKRVTGQSVMRVENPDIADVYNTCLKIGKKRAHVDGVLTVTAASDLLTQDLEDLPQFADKIVDPPTTRSSEESTSTSRTSSSTGPKDVTPPEKPSSTETGEPADQGKPSSGAGTVQGKPTTTSSTASDTSGVSPKDLERLVEIFSQRWGASALKLLEDKYGNMGAWSKGVCEQIGTALKERKTEEAITAFLLPPSEPEMSDKEASNKADLMVACQKKADLIKEIGGEEAIDEFNMPKSPSAWTKMTLPKLEELLEKLDGYLADADIPF